MDVTLATDAAGGRGATAGPEPSWARRLRWPVLALIVVLFCARNLPWNLDEFDQAKQAFTSFEMVEQGHWLYQHSPRGGTAALKPPLTGWCSAAIYYLTGGSWEIAWRLPSLIAGLAVLSTLWREGVNWLGEEGGLLAAAAFGLNILAPRLSTLVDTNMMIAAWTFLAGWVVYRMAREAAANPESGWTARSRWLLAAFLFAGLMTKGPVIYAFLLPGLLADYFLSRRFRLPFHAWSGWWPWLLPMAPFILWVGWVTWRDPTFYHEVVLKEFLGRFTVGQAAVHKGQPFYFYLVHLSYKFAPWSLLLAGLVIFSPAARRVISRDPAALWLACWVVGGFVFMSLVPSKRADRIFPVVPPLCLLVAAMAVAARRSAEGVSPSRLYLATTVVAALLWTGYIAWAIRHDYRHGADALVRFAAEVRGKAASENLRFGVIEGPEEGLWIYLRKIRPLQAAEALGEWQAGRLDAVVCEPDEAPEFGNYRVLASSAAKYRREHYLFIGRAAR